MNTKRLLCCAASVSLLSSPASAQVPSGDYKPAQWLGPSAISYGLPDLSNFPALSFDYCRWGNFQDSDLLEISGPYELGFTPLTGYPLEEDLFLNRYYGFDYSLDRIPFPAETSWSEEYVSIPQEGYGLSLFRYLHFPESIGRANWRSFGDSVELDESVEELILMTHGWNGSGVSNQMSSEFSLIYSVLQRLIQGSRWTLANYHWERDSDTGGLISGGIIGGISGTEAAEIGRQHGAHLATLLRDACPRLKKLHLIAHSAGAWLIRECARQLTLFPEFKDLQIEMTFLDPFIPDESLTLSGNTQIDSSLNNDGMEKILRPAASGGDFGDLSRIWRLENYYAFDISVGTNESFDWPDEADKHVNRLIDVFDSSEFGNHSGPVLFYGMHAAGQLLGDSVSYLSPFALLELALAKDVGFRQSLFWSEPSVTEVTHVEAPIFRNPGEGISDILGKVGTNGSHRDTQYLSDESNAPAIRYQWYKRQNGVATLLTDVPPVELSSPVEAVHFFKDAVTAADAGTFGIRVESRFNGAVQTADTDLLRLGVKQEHVISDGLLGWWEFDENLLDISGGGNHGSTYHGAPISYIPDRFGRSSSALLLKTNAYVTVPDSPSLRVGPTASVAYWVHLKPLPGQTAPGDFIPCTKMSEPGRLIMTELRTISTEAGMQMKVQVPGRYETLSYYADNEHSKTVCDPSKWAFVAVTYNNGAVSIYINGERERTQVFSSADNPQESNNPLYFGFGGARDNEFNYLARAIDSLKLWNRALSPEEILTLFNSDLPVTAPLVLPEHKEYSVWIQRQKGALGSSATAPTADANNNGVPNLMEYSLTPIAGGAHEREQPQLEILGDGSQRFHFSRNNQDPHLLFRVEASTDLVRWDSYASGSTASILPSNPNGVQVLEEPIQGGTKTYITVPPVTQGQRFFRLKVESLPSP